MHYFCIFQSVVKHEYEAFPLVSLWSFTPQPIMQVKISRDSWILSVSKECPTPFNLPWGTPAQTCAPEGKNHSLWIFFQLKLISCSQLNGCFSKRWVRMICVFCSKWVARTRSILTQEAGGMNPTVFSFTSPSVMKHKCYVSRVKSHFSVCHLLISDGRSDKLREDKVHRSRQENSYGKIYILY